MKRKIGNLNIGDEELVNQDDFDFLVPFGTIFWIQKGEEFKRASEVIYEKIVEDRDLVRKYIKENNLDQLSESYSKESLCAVYFFLISVSIENVIKGAILRKNPELVESGVINKKITTHNVYKLFIDFISINLEADEETFLKTAGVFLDGYGKYPFAKENKNMITGANFNYGESKRSYESLYKRTIRIIKNLHEQRGTLLSGEFWEKYK